MEQQELVQEILGGVADMMKDLENRMDAKMDTQRTEIFAFIENSVQKDVHILSEKVTSIDKRLTAMEETLADLCEDMSVVKTAVAHQEREIYELKRVQG